MEENVVDINAYKIEKSLRENGFIVKRDDKRNITLLIKLKE